MITAGSIVALKTTGEEVFVLDIFASHAGDGLTVPGPNDTANVRRPVMTQNGIQHLLEKFTLAELESVESRRARELADRVALHQNLVATNIGGDVSA